MLEVRVPEEGEGQGHYKEDMDHGWQVGKVAGKAVGVEAGMNKVVGRKNIVEVEGVEGVVGRRDKDSWEVEAVGGR